LFILGALSFAAAYLGRSARRHRWRNWVKLHITGMGSSYVLLLIAFYVDNGKSLPLWKELPPTAYWLLPAAIGIPLIVRALLWHPLAGRPPARQAEDRPLNAFPPHQGVDDCRADRSGSRGNHSGMSRQLRGDAGAGGLSGRRMLRRFSRKQGRKDGSVNSSADYFDASSLTAEHHE
jgi:hypothetical protein